MKGKERLEVLDWEQAKRYLYSMKDAYEGIGMSRMFGLGFNIYPIVKRFESGERTQELYDEIMCLE